MAEKPKVGDAVAASQHLLDRGNHSILDRRRQLLYQFVATLAESDRPKTTLQVTEALRAYLKTCPGDRDTQLEDAVTALLGTHDAWKVLNRFIEQLSISAKSTSIGDLRHEQFQDVSAGDDSKYLESIGVPREFQELLADFYREAVQAPEAPQENQHENAQAAEKPQENQGKTD